MGETLLQFVLKRLDAVEEPRISHGEIAHFPRAELGSFFGAGVLRKAEDTDRVHRPTKHGQMSELVVQKTARGLYGVAEGDDYFEPVPLTQEDVRQYEIVVGKLASEIRSLNEIDGGASVANGGLLFIGERALSTSERVQVYLAFPNYDYEVFRARYQRLRRSAGTKAVILLTPQPVAIPPEDHANLDAAGILLVSLWASAKRGILALDWEHLRPKRPRGHPRPAPARVNRDRQLYDEWREIKGKLGPSRKEFAKSRGLSIQEFRQLLDRERKRRQSAAE